MGVGPTGFCKGLFEKLHMLTVYMYFCECLLSTSGVPEIMFWGGSTISVVSGQRERGNGGGSPLVRGSAQFANE
jgi:hypothetical protein